MFSLEKALQKVLVQFLKDMKAEIEKDGLIPTLDEAIERAESWGKKE